MPIFSVEKDFKVKNGLVVVNTLTVLSASQSTSTTTGAMLISGGAGIQKNLNVGGDVRVAGSLFVQGVDLLSYDGDVWYVAGNGSNTNDGRRPQSAFATIKYALSQASSGDKVYVEPGDYYEIFPLTIPQGVSLIGAGLRATQVYPTTATNTEIAMLMNGETYVSNLTIRGFRKPGYAFSFAPSLSVNARSPYIERVTVLTQGSITSSSDPYGFNQNDAGNGAYIDGSYITTSSIEAAMLFNEVTFITPNATGIYMTNGTRCELLNCFFYFADKAIHTQAGISGFGGQGKTKLRLQGITGNITPGDYLHYATSSGTVIAKALIQSTASGGYVYLNGPVYGFETIYNRTGKTVYAYNAAKQSTTQKKFNISSLYLDGNASYLQSPSDPDFGYNTGDFCIEFFYYPNNFANFRVLVDQRTASTDPTAYIDVTPSGTVRYIVSASSITSVSALTSSTWNHIAVSRASGITRLFVNGVVQASTLSDTISYPSRPIRIGGDYVGNSAYWVDGYIDEFRVTKGAARYTGTFTPTTTAFVGDASTVLLLHFDNGNNSTTFIDDALGTQNVYTTGTNTGTASRIVLADYHQFGAEIRSIGCAVVYGNQGVIADGTGTDLKLIAFNVSHVGSGKDLSSDESLVIQSNEIIQTNGGKIYYQTIDQSGDFRVGQNFTVNQRTGNVSFQGGTVSLGNLANLTISDGVKSTVIDPGAVQIDQISIGGTTINSLSGDLTLDPAGTNVVVNSNLQVTGSATINGAAAITTSTLLGGTDTSVIQTGSNTVINNTSTLQSVTGRGATTNAAISITNATQSSSTSTGALTVAGGIGAGGNLNVDGNANIGGVSVILNTTNATSTGTGALQVRGGVGVANDLVVGGFLNVTGTNVIWSTNQSISTTSGALQVKGGAGIAGNVTVGGTLSSPGFTANGDGTVVSVNGQLQANSTTNATSTTTGALRVTGGVGIGGNLHVGGEIVAQKLTIQLTTITTTLVQTDDIIKTENTTTSNSVSSGALQISGGAGIAKDVYVGQTLNVAGVSRFTNTDESLATTSGSVIISGGLGIAKNLHVGGTIYGNVDVSGSISTATNLALGTTGQIPYQLNPGQTFFVGPGNAGEILTSQGAAAPAYRNTLTLAGTTSATSTNTGALQVRGGVGIGGSLYVGGNVSATTVFANLTGNATSADKWSSSRTVTLAGDLSGSVTFDGSSNVTLTATVQADSVALGTDTTGIYVASAGVTGFGLSGSASSEAATFTVSSNATSTNTVSTLVYRDGSGNFSAGTITANLSGNATSADKWSSARTITLAGDLGGSTTIDGSGNVTLTATIQTDSVALGTDTTGVYVATGAVSGFGLTGSASSEGAAFTVTSNATSTNTVSTIVFRDGSGNFSANIITANSITGNSTSADKWSAPRTITLAGDLGGSASFDGSANFTLTATIQANSVALGTDTTGVYVATGAVSGFGLTGSASAESAAFTVTSDATSTDTVSTIVYRNANGSFSTKLLNITSNTNATSTTTGALQVTGGVGIGGNLYVGGEVVAQKLTIEYTTVTTTLV